MKKQVVKWIMSRYGDEYFTLSMKHRFGLYKATLKVFTGGQNEKDIEVFQKFIEKG